jgi:hypothetical protein
MLQRPPQNQHSQLKSQNRMVAGGKPNASRTRTTKARDSDSAAVGPNLALNGHAKQATVRAVVFEIPWGTAREWPGPATMTNGIGQSHRRWRSET